MIIIQELLKKIARRLELPGLRSGRGGRGLVGGGGRRRGGGGKLIDAGTLEDLGDNPMLALTEGAGRVKADAVSDVAEVVLVVGHELGGPLHVAVVELVVEQPIHRHHYRLLHLVRHHHPHHSLHHSLYLSPNRSAPLARSLFPFVALQFHPSGLQGRHPEGIHVISHSRPPGLMV